MVADRLDDAGIMGFGSIKDTSMTDKKQCALFTTEYLYKIIKALRDMKSKQTYVTVEKGALLLSPS